MLSLLTAAMSRALPVWLAVAMLCPTLAARAADALFVANSATGSAADLRAIAQLELAGFDVTVMAASTVSSADANGKALVLVSASVASGQVSNKFTASAVPVIVWEPFVYDDMGMTGPTANTDFGVAAGQQTLDVVGTSALAAGLAGSVVITTAIEEIGWGVPAATAIVAASVTGAPGHAALFGYESGAAMANGTAPARRVGIFLEDTVARRWTADSVQLFDAAVAWATSGPAPDKARVAAIGDSITSGSGTRDSYRAPLWGLLVASGCAVDMTGSQNGPDQLVGIDADHQGHFGFRSDQVAALLPAALLGNAPDAALVHLGTNDVLQSVAPAVVKEHLRTIIGLLRSANAEVDILLAQIIPNHSANEAAVQALNAEIAALADEETTSGSPVWSVDHYTGYDSPAFNSDGVHPNAEGEAFMAQRWQAALLPVLGAQCASAQPVPALGPLGGTLVASLLGLLAALRLRAAGAQSGRRRNLP